MAAFHWIAFISHDPNLALGREQLYSLRTMFKMLKPSHTKRARYGFIGLGCCIMLAGVQAFAQKPLRVEQLYAQNCATCHGDKLQGGLAGSLLDDLWLDGGSDASIAASIGKGNLERGMPAFGDVLSEDAIRALVIYIREARKNHQPPQEPENLANDILRTRDYSLQVHTIAEGFDLPWSLCFLPNGSFLVTERPGGLWLVDASGKRQRIEGVPEVYAVGQGGMLDVAIAPDYAQEPWVYLSFSDKSQQDPNRGMTRIVRGKILNGTWTHEQTLFQAEDSHYVSGGVHFGCRIVFDKDGFLYFTIGDRGRQDQAQRLDVPNGKTHRIHADGSIPKDNPFVGQANALPSIWTFGNRNAQGQVYDPKTQRIWQTEHGPRGGDELNLIQAGHNYGWPKVTFGMNYNGTPITEKTRMEGITDPWTHWTPSIAVCGLDIYHGEPFGKYAGNLLVGALRQQELRRVVLNDQGVIEQEIIFKNRGRVRDVVVGPEGFIYIVLNSPGKIVALKPVD